MKIYWTRPTESGLGDRLADLLLAATYARILNSELYVSWVPYRGHENPVTKALDPEHRFKDILIENVKQFIIFPNNVISQDVFRVQNFNYSGWITDAVKLKRLSEHFTLFNVAIGGTADPRGFWLHNLSAYCTYEEFESHKQLVANEFRFCSAINDYLATLPERFMAFHIRRGDKVRNEVTDQTFIHISEIDHLNDLTYKALNHYVDKYDHFFICSDQDEKKKEFSNFLTDRGKKIITLPDLPKWQQTYYDMAVMTKSEVNMASNRYSSFSRFPSIIGKNNWHTVYDFEVK